MATLLLSAAGAAIGGSLGGSIAGIASGVLGKAVGATLGAVIDQKLTGLGSEPVETGRVERFRVMGASEGAPLPRVFGRARVAGQIIWSSRFIENIDSRNVRGKGSGRRSQEVREYSYSISLALAICEGEVMRVGRVWADGQRLDLAGVTWRLHGGSDDQLPDPVIAAVEGADQTPAYRGTAYVVFENLDLTPFGNRIPQFNFEVFRRATHQPSQPTRPTALDVRAVALVPGTGEYALATTPVFLEHGKGQSEVVNVNNDRGRPDLLVSLEQMEAELPRAKAVSLVVSWFGNDLRCDRCTLQPAVEQARTDGAAMPWRVSGTVRSNAKIVSQVDGRPLFGGTPSDASVIQAIEHMSGSGQAVMFYPFILMDITAGNGLHDPWTGGDDQPPVPWRGRITLSRAPGRPNSPDKTPAAGEQVDAFFGAARPSHFGVSNGSVVYSGPQEWSYRRFILHYAKLCALTGRVDAFCIGSEMRSLTQVRDGDGSYPAVRALRALAEDVRAIMGPNVKLGYAADWSEYFGHQPSDGSGDVMYHLDPLWAHRAIDFVGIDNYMPLSDWRDGSGHLDAAAGSIYDVGYLTGNVQGGEGYDYFYADDAARERQNRTPITDGAHSEAWVFRYKDITNWWSRAHHNRLAGVRDASPTEWSPQSKPIWFTELGCPAVDKGTNQPNVFLDPKSSESFFPYFSSGARDDFIQNRYLRAMFDFWNDPANNPPATGYAGRMVDMDRAFVWAWDARPWPDFPDRLETWVDGLNFDRGHWLNARICLPTLAETVVEICERAGAGAVDVGSLDGGLTGFTIGSVETARQSLQPLMLAKAFDSFSASAKIAFASRHGRVTATLDPDAFATLPQSATFEASRGPAGEAAGRVALGFVRSDLDYQSGAIDAVSPEVSEPDTAQLEAPLVLSDGEAKAVAERWLSEGMVARDSIKFDLPLSALALAAGDVVKIAFPRREDLYRVDRVEDLGHRSVTAVRVEPSLYESPHYSVRSVRPKALRAPTPVHAEFLDLPLLSGEEVASAPYIAVTQTPWAGAVAVYSSASENGYEFNREVLRPAVMGQTLSAIPGGIPGQWMRASLRVRIFSGSLQSRSEQDVLNGSNAIALRFGATGDWEVMQFATARLVAPGEYELEGLLRGQAGTDGVAPEVWPAGADFVLLDAAVVQLRHPRAARALTRRYRVGAAVRAYDDPSYVESVQTFSGVGLRPYRPAHLALRRLADGGATLTWTRRTRIDGDSWDGLDVPLGEDRESYSVGVHSGSVLLREVERSATTYTYRREDWLEDGSPSALRFAVAQLSDRFGPGPSAWVVAPS